MVVELLGAGLTLYYSAVLMYQKVTKEQLKMLLSLQVLSVLPLQSFQPQVVQE